MSRFRWPLNPSPQPHLPLFNPFGTQHLQSSILPPRNKVHAVHYLAFANSKVYSSAPRYARVDKMAAENQLRINLGRPIPHLNAHECLYVHQGTEENALTVSFKRTIRVVSLPVTLRQRLELTFGQPDDDTTYQLPPNLGNFPLYNVAHYKETLPESMMLKGGCFMPVHGTPFTFKFPPHRRHSNC